MDNHHHGGRFCSNLGYCIDLMKKKFIYTWFLVAAFPLLVSGQQVFVLSALQDSIKETSGLIYLNQKLITHNDSEGRPALYELDSITGNVTRTVAVTNATNIDWEDIDYDSTYLYIGDFGNDGSRTDLNDISPSDFKLSDH